MFPHRTWNGRRKPMSSKIRWTGILGLALGSIWILGAAQDGPTKLDPGLRNYEVVSGVSGNASSVGSDTLNNLMTFWAESFKKFYPNVNIQIEGKGSGTAPPALTTGTSQFGPM